MTPVVVVLLMSMGLLVLFWSGCKSPSESNPEEKLFRLSGRVLNSRTNQPLANAVVRITNIDPEIIQLTNNKGEFSAEFTVDSTLNLLVIVTKENFTTDSTEVLAIPGRSVDLSTIALKPVSEQPTATGEGASIVLLSQTVESIGVQGSGDNESLTLLFEVRDSTGQPLDIAHSVQVRFSIASGPGGGETIFPTEASTDNAGQVATTVTSGTIAGVVQVLAEATVQGRQVRSQPVAVTIHGGLPDQNHFSVGASQLNFPGLVLLGLLNPVTAYVGDKYSNPVRPGTAVYFATDGGIIEGSALTDELGTATVDLMSAAPAPVHPELGPGFATITASTVDENQNTISVQTLVLFSGSPTISMDPMSFLIPNGGAQNFTYTVSDQNGNPLAKDTQITVTVGGDGIKTQGTLSATLPDTQSRGWTMFSFTVVDQDTASKFRPINIEIKVTGPNGAAILQTTGGAE
ncbi:MAG: hypothetical protein D6715_01280 [Calditrichaeota bacterium]|nr:MAG: hypothetical protein D6715_01280 [Calditrichota bacterium]